MPDPVHIGTWCKLKIVVVTGPAGTLNGYVGIAKGHPLCGVEYNTHDQTVLGGQTPESYFWVHGGITYSGKECPDYKDKKSAWWYGFDTNHAMDQKYPKNATFVKRHCRRLAKRLSRWSPKHVPIKRERKARPGFYKEILNG